jgi:hypothetical protein
MVTLALAVLGHILIQRAGTLSASLAEKFIACLISTKEKSYLSSGKRSHRKLCGNTQAFPRQTVHPVVVTLMGLRNRSLEVLA